MVINARHSPAYGQARSKAASYLNNGDELQRLTRRASAKAKGQRGPLAAVWASLSDALRLLKAYAKGEYRAIPWESLLLIVASVLYFLMPLDLVADFIPGLGLLDDAALLGWTLNSVKTDIDNFVQWEQQQ